MPASKRKGSGASPAAKKARSPEEEQKAALMIKSIDTIRVLSADVVEKANSGHPGAPMGCAPIAYLLWSEFMNYSPKNPKWLNRDRFVLSNGHACALLYSMLHLTGYEVSMDDLKRFRQSDSITPGHPENFMTAGVEVSTGPLGQGISNAVGMAMAEKHLASIFNKEDMEVVDHYTYVICGDGCLQEGVSSEACSLAGHLGLGKLIVCYDDNHITIDGDTDVSFTEDVLARYKSYGWHTQTVSDVNNISSLRDAITKAQNNTEKPSLIKIRTVIGHGSSKQGTEKVHGAPLGAADMKVVKEYYGFNPEESFIVPDEVATHFSTLLKESEEKEKTWNELMEQYKEKYSTEAEELFRRFNGDLPTGWQDALPNYTFPEEKTVATRNRSEEVLNALAPAIPELIGGSADLTGSNLTYLKCTTDFQKDTPEGRYLRFGVREHGMAAICNGMMAHGGVRPFCATFLNFIGYALGAVRIAALSRFGIIYVMTHDSIGLGEDGPTHQPVEMLEQLRATPNLLCFRPGNSAEVAGSYEQALLHPTSPSVICLSRQGIALLPGASREKVAKGAYIISTHGSDADAVPLSVVLVSSGSEVPLCDLAAALLAEEGVRVQVVSMPCWELFEEQSMEYQLEVFPVGVPVLSVEASGIHGWSKYSHAAVGLSGYGKSGPGPKIMAEFGFTKENVRDRAKDVISFYKDSVAGAPSLIKVPKFAKLGGH